MSEEELAAGVLRWAFRRLSRAEKKRAGELRRAATTLGLAEDAEVAANVLQLLDRSPGDIEVSDVYVGTWEGYGVKLFDASVRFAFFGPDTYHRFTCALAQVPAAFPYVAVERKEPLSEATYRLLLPGSPIEVVSAGEEIAEAFVVEASDRWFATSLLDGGVTAWLLDRRGQWTFEVKGDSILCLGHQPDIFPAAKVDSIAEVIHANEIPMLVEALRGFVEAVPDSLFHLYPAPS